MHYSPQPGLNVSPFDNCKASRKCQLQPIKVFKLKKVAHKPIF